MEFLSATCQALLLVVFGAAVVGKVQGAASFAAFTDAVAVLGRVPAGRAGALAAALVGAEAATAVLLAVPRSRGLGLLAAAGLLSAFTYAVARALRSGTPVSCRCFGASAGPVGPPQLLRNAVLLVAVTAALPGVPGSDGLPWQGQFAAWLAGATAALVLVVGDELVSLLRPRPAAPGNGSPRPLPEEAPPWFTSP
ncbi:MauE/DoxX family redox-associated membrane protein [Streptomyces sp. QH1-20]|uniref:MauE/DoxX family redox-associated membrane protein n=1 Tax=Streptomyces sp. QH1-20 TaxID=3240934 RepID=UPI0035164EAA